MAEGRAEAVRQIVRDLRKKRFETDQKLRLVKEWAPTDEQQGTGEAEFRVRWVQEE
jgi:hypothetical protein